MKKWFFVFFAFTSPLLSDQIAATEESQSPHVWIPTEGFNYIADLSTQHNWLVFNDSSYWEVDSQGVLWGSPLWNWEKTDRILVKKEYWHSFGKWEYGLVNLDKGTKVRANFLGYVQK